MRAGRIPNPWIGLYGRHNVSTSKRVKVGCGVSSLVCVYVLYVPKLLCSGMQRQRVAVLLQYLGVCIFVALTIFFFSLENQAVFTL